MLPTYPASEIVWYKATCRKEEKYELQRLRGS